MFMVKQYFHKWNIEMLGVYDLMCFSGKTKISAQLVYTVRDYY